MIINFTQSNEDIINPERGLIGNLDMYWSQQSDYDNVRSNGYSWARGSGRLDDYRDSSLPQSYLDNLDAAFDKARNAKIKLIVRFSYGNDDDDAPKSRILEHINQVAPILNDNKDVTACHQLGFIGWWGEWHHSSNGLDNTEDRRDITYAYLDAVEDRPIQIRIPWWKYEIFGEHLDSANAFDGSRLSRTGHYNDGFIAPYWGYVPQYGVPEEGIEYWQSIIANEGLFVPVGGESSYLHDGANCANAYSVTDNEHWDFLNSVWHPDVITELDNGGCWSEISQKLGYRFVLKSMTVNNPVLPGEEIDLHIELDNLGYTAPFNERPIYIVLENGSIVIEVELDDDIRYWQSGTIQIDKTIDVSIDIERGDYNLHLWLPDAVLQNQEYAIRCANDDVWQSETGFNLLGQITIEDHCLGIERAIDYFLCEIGNKLRIGNLNG